MRSLQADQRVGVAAITASAPLVQKYRGGACRFWRAVGETRDILGHLQGAIGPSTLISRIGGALHELERWCVAQESNLVISLRCETDFDWALPISEPRERMLPYILLKQSIFIKFNINFFT